ncbi:MAG TPA: GNAT family N-acetyltransferase [Caulobacteraceae bacterium]|nr:GNAT family N-acetyltransferase [Caulobacteraceae bacterium]
MNLRPATQADAAALAQVHAASFAAAWSADEIRRFAADPGGFALVADEAGEAAGFILCRVVAGEAEVLTLAVRPSFRRRGVALALLEAALALAAPTAQAMLLEVAADNPGALALYAMAGFSTVGQRAGYYARSGAPAVDAIVMRRALNS